MDGGGRYDPLTVKHERETENGRMGDGEMDSTMHSIAKLSGSVGVQHLPRSQP